MLKLLVSMTQTTTPAIVAIVAGAFVLFVARLIANRQHVKRLQNLGAVSQLLDALLELILMISSLCRNTILCSAILLY
jgi:hypothetical protein